jgi:hypothetical protein
LPVRASQLIEKTSVSSVKELKGSDLEEALSNAAAKELYLQEREILDKKSNGQTAPAPHRGHIQPYVNTATAPITEFGFSTASEALVTMVVKQLVDEELEKEKSKAQLGELPTFISKSDAKNKALFYKTQQDSIKQLEHLAKELETEVQAVLKFEGVLAPEARGLGSMLQGPSQ